MKVCIVRVPQREVDGIRIDLLIPGRIYDLSSTLAAWLVCEGYAEPFIESIGGQNPGRQVGDS